MKIGDEKFKVTEVFNNFITVPDCIVVSKNKLGRGHGEAKLYFGSKTEMRSFYGGEGFNAKCFILKEDLIKFMEAMKGEYMSPSQEYIGKENMPELWKERMELINTQKDVIEFNVQDQTQITGERGYINSEDEGYQLIRKLALPLVSYISAMELKSNKGSKLFYWKLFADFDAIWEKKNGPLVFNYGKKAATEEKEEGEVVEEEKERKESKKEQEIRYARIGQGKYREKLLEECPYCPITMINDERLLIASHIKPWIASDDKEKVDPKNGYILSPLYDKLFDRGFITFTPERKMLVSDWISPKNQERMGLKNDTFIRALPMDEDRIKYLKFHADAIYKG